MWPWIVLTAVAGGIMKIALAQPEQEKLALEIAKLASVSGLEKSVSLMLPCE